MDDPGVLSADKCMKPIDYIKSDVNILLLGESGVGKSTFINSFANYLQYDTLEKALKSELYCLIPTVFTITDEHFDDKKINFGFDDNEDTQTGNSSTQYPRAYVFPIEGQQGKIRLIDTPGIGDSRGIEQDEKNFENILTYLSLFTEIHAICFLLKPNVTVINAYFKFCIKHLISRLEVSASKNIVFIFTNSRGTFYRPGSTSGLLEIILNDIKANPPYVEIPFSKENKFCVDNEVFNYLVAVRKGVSFGDAEKNAYIGSWEKSVQATRSFLSYIAGNDRKEGLKPHRMQNTKSVNDARRLVLDLTKPLTDISDLIQDNLCALNIHKKHILNENLSMADLEKSLYIPVINLKQTSLPDPVVVCTSNTCAKICIVQGLKKYHYKQKCCKRCTSNNILRELIGSPSLLNCSIFDSNKQCKECKCDFSCHMQISYETKLHEDTVVDETIKKEIKSKEDMIEARYKIIMAIKGRISDYEEERDIITKAVAKFAHFLKNNSISSYNDAFQDYIDYLIDRENSHPQKNNGVLTRYKYMKKQHEEEKKLLDNVKDDGESLVSITPEEIQKFIESLYNLKYNGKKIRELHNKQQKVGQNLHLKTMVEYCHPKKIERNPERAKTVDRDLGDGKNNQKKKARNQERAKTVERELGKMTLEELQKNTEMEELLQAYLKDKLGGSGAKAKEVKENKSAKKDKKINADSSNKNDSGNKNEKVNKNEFKNNVTQSDSKNDTKKTAKDGNKKKDVTHIKNNLEKDANENKTMSHPNHFQNAPNQYQFPHPANQPPMYPQMNPMRPQMNPNQYPMQQNYFPGPPNQYQMQQNQIPMQQNYYPMPGNQYHPPMNATGFYQNPAEQRPPSYQGNQAGPSGNDAGRSRRSGTPHRGKPRGGHQNVSQTRERNNKNDSNPPSHHGSMSNLSEASGSDIGKFPKTGKQNSRGKPRGTYKNVNQSRDNTEQTTPHYKKNVNQFKKAPARKSRKSDDDSDSESSHASSHKRSDKNAEKEQFGDKLDYQKMLRFLEDQKKVIADVNKKSSGGDKKRKSETIIMMISKDE